MRAAALAGCLIALAACTGPSPQNAPRSQPDRAETGTGVTVSGYAIFGYVKGN